MNLLRSIKRRSLGFLAAGFIPAAALLSQTPLRISQFVLAGMIIAVSLVIGLVMGWCLSSSSKATGGLLLSSPLLTTFSLFSLAIAYATLVIQVPFWAFLSGVQMAAPMILICSLPTFGFALIGQDLQIAASNKRSGGSQS